MKYFLIAGEASGDLHASNLMRELKRADKDAEFCFLGGDLMQQQGGRLVIHYRQMAFMGIIAVALHLRTVLGNLKKARQSLVEFRPDVLILVDYPSFNLRMAEYCKKQLGIPVYYYISPKIWAWKEYRIKAIKRYIDRMFTIFPFETEFYAGHDYPVEYVGNPTVDSVHAGLQAISSADEFRAQNSLPAQPIIALLAGSRRQEIANCLPRMVEAASAFGDFQPVIAGAPGIDAGFYASVLKSTNSVPVIFDKTYEIVKNSSAAIVNSGTATLETALIGTPEVVIYHIFGGRLANWLKKLVIKTEFISLVNLIAGKESVKELYGALFTIENVKKELAQLLENNEYRQRQLADFDEIARKLGNPGAASHAAERIIHFLKKEAFHS